MVTETRENHGLQTVLPAAGFITPEIISRVELRFWMNFGKSLEVSIQQRNTIQSSKDLLFLKAA
jgi:hypothetical protein